MKINEMKDAFSEYFEIGSLDDKEQAKYYLIHRYKLKVSTRLLDEYKKLRTLGKEKFAVNLKEIVSRPNPFLALIPKLGTDFSGKYYPVPIIYENK